MCVGYVNRLAQFKEITKTDVNDPLFKPWHRQILVKKKRMNREVHSQSFIVAGKQKL